MEIDRRALQKLAEDIRLRRKKLGLTQRELAQLASVTQVSIVNLEGSAGCNNRTLVKVLFALGLEISLTERVRDKRPWEK